MKSSIKAKSQLREAVGTFSLILQLPCCLFPLLHQLLQIQFTVMTNNDPKYAHPYPAQQGYYQEPPVVPPPQYTAAPPPRKKTGFLEGCLAALCCCCLIDECCDPSGICF